eukprot:Clim_evm2s86 gene=Clim_evmTU2s86
MCTGYDKYKAVMTPTVARSAPTVLDVPEADQDTGHSEQETDDPTRADAYGETTDSGTENAKAKSGSGDSKKKNHVRKRQTYCEKCSKYFAGDLSKLKRHMAVHEGRKRSESEVCPWDQCGKTIMGDRSKLKRHLKVHAEKFPQGPFVCAFRKADAKVHDGAKAYECPDNHCNTMFLQNSNLRKHELDQHGQILDDHSAIDDIGAKRSGPTAGGRRAAPPSKKQKRNVPRSQEPDPALEAGQSLLALREHGSNTSPKATASVSTHAVQAGVDVGIQAGSSEMGSSQFETILEEMRAMRKQIMELQKLNTDLKNENAGLKTTHSCGAQT